VKEPRFADQNAPPVGGEDTEPVSGMVHENGLLVYRTGKPLPLQIVDDRLHRMREGRSLHLLGKFLK
jgi:hypothetical protein